MRAILTDKEVREILTNALNEKTQYVLGEVKEENCYFVIKTPEGEIDDVESVEFSGEY